MEPFGRAVAPLEVSSDQVSMGGLGIEVPNLDHRSDTGAAVARAALLDDGGRGQQRLDSSRLGAHNHLLLTDLQMVVAGDVADRAGVADPGREDDVELMTKTLKIGAQMALCIRSDQDSTRRYKRGSRPGEVGQVVSSGASGCCSSHANSLTLQRPRIHGEQHPFAASLLEAPDILRIGGDRAPVIVTRRSAGVRGTTQASAGLLETLRDGLPALGRTNCFGSQDCLTH